MHSVPGRAVSTEGAWPQVRDDDWCGEWQVREKRPEEAAPLHVESLLGAGTASTDATALNGVAAGPRESLMIPAGASPEPQPVNHFASD